MESEFHSYSKTPSFRQFLSVSYHVLTLSQTANLVSAQPALECTVIGRRRIVQEKWQRLETPTPTFRTIALCANHLAIWTSIRLCDTPRDIQEGGSIATLRKWYKDSIDKGSYGGNSFGKPKYQMGTTKKRKNLHFKMSSSFVF